MKTRIVIPLALIGLFSVGSAYAMTGTQAKQLSTTAYKGNAVDLAKLETVANSRDAAAQFWLSVYWDTKNDFSKAYSWYEKAADQGFAMAENNLENTYNNGHGVPQDYAKANYWYEKAAAKGYADAENNLGVAYFNGQGVTQDTMTAITWWKKAAAQGGRVGSIAQNNIKLLESRDSRHFTTVKMTTTRSALVHQEEATNTGRFTTDCDNMSCVRRYSNGAVIH